MIRYFERVLGLVRVAGFPAVPEQGPILPRESTASSREVLLVDFDRASRVPSLDEMSVRLQEAVSSEIEKLTGVKQNVRWCEPSVDKDRANLIIGFGASSDFGASDARVVRAPTLREMAGSPAVKREGWRLILEGIQRTN